MKRRYKIFISILFCFLVALPIATSLLWQENVVETSTENIEVDTPTIENIIDDDKEGAVTTWTEPTYKTYEDYFTDYNITAETITEEDLSGTGSAIDAYVVHSTRGFLYLTNYDLSSAVLNGRYVELDCDVVLNEEVFDENGNPSGGDGIVYNWKPSDGGGMRFNGNGHFIRGIYNTSGNNSNSMFYGEMMKCENLNISDFYIVSGSSTATISTSVITISNCIAYSSTIKGTLNLSGLVCYARNVSNCVSYTNIYATSTQVAGIVAHSRHVSGTYLTIENCINYGNIVAEAYNVGGIVACVENTTEIVNCKNYGNVYGKQWGVGGILGFSSGMKNALVMRDCINFGTISSQSSGTGGVLGYVGYGGEITINHCENYGKIFSSPTSFATGGTILGGFHNSGVSEECNINISNCSAESNGYSLVGSHIGESSQIYSSYGLNFNIRNCNIILLGENIDNALIIAGNLINKIDFYAENIKVKSQSQNSFKLMNNIQTTSIVELKNVLVICDENLDENYLYASVATNAKMNIKSLLYEENNDSNYYGTDFSGFYCDWKTGEIGLKALSGKGFYQNTLTEDILIAKGFEKKAV